MAAIVTWLGALGGWTFGVPGTVAALVVALVVGRGNALLAMLVVAGAMSGMIAAARVDETLASPVPTGAIQAVGRVADEPVIGPFATRFVLAPSIARPDGFVSAIPLPPVGVELSPAASAPVVGDTVEVTGSLRASPGRIRGDPVAGILQTDDLKIIQSAGQPFYAVGNMARRRVHSVLGAVPPEPGRALLAGFLIGDTSGVSRSDMDALRRSGLTHFVAVSGSNVALFLAGWWLVLAPLGRPRTRAAVGLIGLGVFVVITRWEPSVVRAATMAAFVLGGRLAAIPVDAWTALGGAVTLLLLVSGDLASSVGFQLSAAATAGVLAGARMFDGKWPRWLWTALGVTVAAQAAVAPLLLVHFGSVPLLAPVANLLAAPLVVVATALGGIGVVAGGTWLVEVAVLVASAVLNIAHAVSGWPQLGVTGVGFVAVLAAAGASVRLRPMVVAAGGAALLASLLPSPPPAVPIATFLDVGQGDAILIRDPAGGVVLVDGGRDPVVLASALRTYGVSGIDLLVVTHGDADHAGGLVDLLSRRRVGTIWVPDQPDLGELLPDLIADAEARRIPVTHVREGHRAAVGALRLNVLGPRRRYAAINDGSVVLWVEVAGHTTLLPGDIEAVVQRELPPLQPDVMLIPHHGSATSDLDWIEATAGAVVVISVGPNTYGHPSPTVLATLERHEARVFTTEQSGDISVPLTK